ncbi:MAG: tetratricopeptide repeat protein [Acidobacteriota bacterium]
MSSSPAFLSFGAFRLDVTNRLLLRGGEPIALTPKAFDTLMVLVDARHRVVSKDELIETVWPDTFVSEATLTQNIYTLRKTLGEGADGPFIRTIPRRGYRFSATVTVETAPREPSQPSSEGSEPVRPDMAEAIRSLAVLPLRPLVSDEDNRLLGLGLADAVITSLSNVSGLAVRATSSIMDYVDASVRDPVAIGRELRVDGVLEGTVQRIGSRLRVTLQLVSVEQGVACWAETFQGAFRDLFAAQDAVAMEVVTRLRFRLTHREEARLTRRSTHSLEAYRTYVRGRYFWNRRTAADLRRAIELFREAAALDPDYGRAYAGLADALILLPFYGTARPGDSFRQARDAARRAIELDPDLCEAHTSLAYTDFVYSHDWRAAEDGFRRALRHGAHYPTAHHWYAFLLTALGRHDEAIRLAHRALELDPLSLVISTDLAMTYYFARRNDDAIAQLTTVLEVTPTFGYAHFALALSLSQAQRHEQAIAAAIEATKLLPDSGAVTAVLGHVYGRTGRTEDARRVLESLTRDDRPTTQASHRALVLVALDEHRAAIDALHRGREERSRFGALLGVWPAFDPLRSEPRFQALLTLLGLDHVPVGHPD